MVPHLEALEKQELKADWFWQRESMSRLQRDSQL